MDPALNLPVLPDGYEVYGAWGFRDPEGGSSYELNRVYGPPDRADPRGAMTHLDQARSYWAETWEVVGADGETRLAGRCVTFAQARARGRRGLTFEQFSSVHGMRAALPALLDGR